MIVQWNLVLFLKLYSIPKKINVCVTTLCLIENLLTFFHIRAGIETEEEEERTCGKVYWCLGALLFFGYQSCVTKPGLEKFLY